MSDQKPVILTGLRTNAEYHLGNYLGAILPMVELQKKYVGEYQINMFAPDLHSFTMEIDHSKLYGQTLHNLRVFVAAGMPVDSQDFYLYRQSQIPAHSEMTVILNNFTYFGELNRMTQFKDKEEHGEGVTAGLFDYPVLMAADILLYGAKYVPVGEDQRQHLELTRDLAIRLNNKFGELFTVPEPWDEQLKFAGRAEGVRIRSLRRPENKMSKSVEDPAGTILLSDSPQEAKKKIMSATTDNEGKISWDWQKQPGITNLLQILELITGSNHEKILSEWQNQNSYGQLKKAVAKAVAEFLSDFSQRIKAVGPEQIESKLKHSERAMSEVANECLAKVQAAVGLRP